MFLSCRRFAHPLVPLTSSFTARENEQLRYRNRSYLQAGSVPKFRLSVIDRSFLHSLCAPRLHHRRIDRAFLVASALLYFRDETLLTARMPNSNKNWGLTWLHTSGRTEQIPIKPGLLTIGRDKENTVQIPDISVSRFHAEFKLENDEVSVVDVGAKNGILVNGVMRSEAVLQTDDEVGIGTARFKITARLIDAARLKPSLDVIPEVDLFQKTSLQPLQLPTGPAERQLAMLYYGCSWLASELAEEKFAENCLRTIREGMSATEAQYYDENGKLKLSICGEEGKSGVRLAGYLAERFKNVPEAVIISGEEIKFHQKNIKDYNYLVGTLCPPKSDRGTYPFIVLIKPAEWKEFTVKDRLLLQALCQLWHRRSFAAQTISKLDKENKNLKSARPAPTLIGESPAMEKLREECAKAATIKFTVTLMGETGSGKEVAAHFIHDQSPRSGNPFVRVNCAAIPASLMENELFGHVKGAYTDAKSDQRGKFELADGGTLFLDEIGELPIDLQSKLLRALESGEIEKIGSEKPIQVDVRVIAATNRNLKEMSDAKMFREDLYFRLTPLIIRIPPLREHVDDIATLAQSFLDQFTEEYGSASFHMNPKGLDALAKHDWPGNVRELKHVMQRCALGADDTAIDEALIIDKLQDPTP